MTERILELIKKYKGAIASVLGFLMAFPVNLWAVFKLIFDLLPTEATSANIEYLKIVLAVIACINFIAMIWFILPSRIIFKSKWLGELTLED
jgi:hypothetical protein